MNDSILVSIKKLLGIAEDYEHFDLDIITHINTVFMILNQMGVGPEECFTIKDKKDVWGDFLKDETKLEGVKTYMHLRVKMMFDPPASGIITEATNRISDELAWRLYITSDKPNE